MVDPKDQQYQKPASPTDQAALPGSDLPSGDYSPGQLTLPKPTNPPNPSSLLSNVSNCHMSRLASLQSLTSTSASSLSELYQYQSASNAQWSTLWGSSLLAGSSSVEDLLHPGYHIPYRETG